MKSEKLIMRIDKDRKSLLLATKAGKGKRSVAVVVIEAIDLYQTRNRIEDHIRASIVDNLKKYPTPGAFTDAMLSATQFRPWRQALTLVKAEDWIISETYIALTEWHRRGATPEALARVLETEYCIPRDALTEPLPFAENEAPAQKQTVDTAREAKPKQTRKRIEATV